jgi:hypothetical protein
MPKNPDEFFRYLIFKTTGDTLKINNSQLINKIKNSNKEKALTMLESYMTKNGLAKLSSIFLRNKNYEENMEDVVIECLEYFGDIKSVDYDEDSNAVELWFSYEEEPHVAYLFGYDEGVVLCK